MLSKWLKETNIDEVHLVGGKNASLGEMIQNLSSLGIKIPNGFVITADGYDKYMESNNLFEKISIIMKEMDIDNLEDLKIKGKQIRSFIQCGEIPEQMKTEILEKYKELSSEYGDEWTDIAVRSSGTAEDMPDASFAGQQDTYLNVRGEEELFHSVKLCFASLFNDRAISYRKIMNYDSINVKLSICVQKMVRSDLSSAGVAFSLDVNSGCKDLIVINGSYGLGEIVVSGQIKPDEFLVFKPTLEKNYFSIIDKTLSPKKQKIIYNTDALTSKDEKTKLVDVETYKQNMFCMNDVKILQLSKWVIEIEKYYSNKYNKWCPMDIEWGIDGLSDELFILQARPETIHSRKTDTELVEYKMIHNQEKKLVLTGIAIGDSISTGKVRKMKSIEDISNDFQQGDILVTEITDPDWEPIMKKASAIITNKGGRTCHAAIVARELGVTAVVGTINCTELLEDGMELTVSCAEGDMGYVYKGILDFQIIKTNINDLPKIKTKLMMNVASPNEAFKFAKIPNCGVGLAREEFIINNYIQAHPLALINYNLIKDKEVQQKIKKLTYGYSTPIDYFVRKLSYGIARIAAAFYPKDVIVRFSDFKSNEYANLLGGRDFEPHEENPMIGWRGASRYYSESYKEAFGLECQAIKYVREVMGLKNIIVMIPFCRTLTECDKVLEVMKEYGLERGINGLKVYLMCEIPSNVILAEQFCKKIDGYSIGSNDLTQLTLGLDRDSELVAGIYDERDEAVKTLLRQVIKVCHENNTKIGICGQGPSDYPDFAEFLVREGIDTISLTPDSVIKNIKVIANIEKTMNLSA
jgi:pyruvate,water dikinase